MIQVKSIVLTAALYGRANAAGCFPAYDSGATYAAGDTVSASTTTDTSTTVRCAPAGDGSCPASGFLTTTTTTTTTNNYECVSGPNSAFCSQSGFEPTGTHSSAAWTKESAECSGTATVTTSGSSASVPAEWSGGGCPAAFVAGTDYAAGDVVSVQKTGYVGVYRCADEPTNLFCGMGGYEPTDGLYMDQAWTALGSCTGTIAPTSSPAFSALPDEGGCPKDFDAGADYDAGDKVAVGGLVYECKAYPLSQHCSQAGYEPGTSISSGAQTVEYWKEAWTVAGFCSGTIAPTGSPSFDVLQNVGGCPDEWSAQTYDEGDRVAANDLVYECKSWPSSGWCGQAGYEPGTSVGSGAQMQEFWKDAWNIIGHCSGNIAPSASPTFDALNSVGGCPDEWTSGSNTAYEEGDMVSVTVSETPIRKIAYKCKAWPYSGYCGQFSPTVFGGDQGWMLAGSCDGSIGPTASPSFDVLSEVSGGCPEEWSASKTDYEAGDQVAYSVSTSPMRKIVYECRSWPNTGYCGQGAGFEPTTQYGSLAWTLKGSCDGSMAPTAAPAMYTGNCTYSQCRDVETTETNCVPGSTGCSCTAEFPASASCTRTVTNEVCSDTDVNIWNSSEDYFTGDVVRVGTKRFQCREWPNYFWCRLEAYRPQLQPNGVWDQAWTEDGMCM